jgi:hypothetical protein
VVTILTERGLETNLSYFVLRKGVIWLLLGTATEIPPLVSQNSLVSPPFLFISFLGVHCVAFEL